MASTSIVRENSTAWQRLQRRVRELEGDPDMRKGRLIEEIIRDDAIPWDSLFVVLELRGRHRRKLRWRRFIVENSLQRTFRRGGARCRRRAPPSTPAPALGRDDDDDATADPQELADFGPAEVWDRFRSVFPTGVPAAAAAARAWSPMPVLSLYRGGWQECPDTAVGCAPSPAVWEAMWCRGTPPPTLEAIGRALHWPAVVMTELPLLLPIARRLWPEGPWSSDDTAAVDDAPARAAVPLLRRAACLVHGFLLGGCDPRGVWEAIRMPDRKKKPDTATVTL